MNPTAPIMVEKPTLTISKPAPITTMPVRWIVITEDNLVKIINEQKKNGDVALVALTSSGYKNLSSNQADILRYIQQQQAIIDAYQEYYKNPQPIKNK
jgi:hypothetical protein